MIILSSIPYDRRDHTSSPIGRGSHHSSPGGVLLIDRHRVGQKPVQNRGVDAEARRSGGRVPCLRQQRLMDVPRAAVHLQHVTLMSHIVIHAAHVSYGTHDPCIVPEVPWIAFLIHGLMYSLIQAHLETPREHALPSQPALDASVHHFPHPPESSLYVFLSGGHLSNIGGGSCVSPAPIALEKNSDFHASQGRARLVLQSFTKLVSTDSLIHTQYLHVCTSCFAYLRAVDKFVCQLHLCNALSRLMGHTEHLWGRRDC